MKREHWGKETKAISKTLLKVGTPPLSSWFKSQSTLTHLITSITPVCTTQQSRITQCTLGQLCHSCFCSVATCIVPEICRCPCPRLPSCLEEWRKQHPPRSPARCSSPCTSPSDCDSAETTGVCHLCGLVLNPLSPLSLKPLKKKKQPRQTKQQKNPH